MSIYKFFVDGNTACMSFNPDGDRYPKELVDASFRREVVTLFRLQSYPWAPEEVMTKLAERKIYFKWYHNTCEHTLSADWKSQLETIAADLHKEKIYKPSFYPKYFYVDDQAQLHAYNFYTAFDHKESPVEVDFYRPILNQDRAELIDSISVDGKLDLKLLMKYAFNDYITWPEDALKTIWKNVYE